MFVEVSYSLVPDEIVMPGPIAKPEVIKRSRMTPQPDGSDEEEVRWGSYNNTSFARFFVHTGTHIEAPYHHLRDGADVSALKIDTLIGACALLDFHGKQPNEAITEQEIETKGAHIERGDIVFIRTDASRRYRTTFSRCAVVCATEVFGRGSSAAASGMHCFPPCAKTTRPQGRKSAAATGTSRPMPVRSRCRSAFAA